MRSIVVLLLALAACKDKPASRPQVASGSATPADAAAAAPKFKLDDAALAARFAELRDDRALGCLLDRSEEPNRSSDVLTTAIEASPSPVLVRIVAFALVQRARREGDSPELAALAEAVRALESVGDVEGLRMAFERVDQIAGLEPPWFGYDEAVRARVVRDLPKAARTRGHLAWVKQTALGGQRALAEEIYDKEVPALDRRPSVDHVGALAALGRDATVKELIASAPENLRPSLVDHWLLTAARAKRPLGDVTTEMVSEAGKRPTSGYPTAETLRAVRGADPAAAQRLRAAEVARWTPAYRDDVPGLVERIYMEVLDAGSDAERATIEPMVPPELVNRERVLRTAPLDEALAFVMRESSSNERGIARVWIRAAIEDPAWLPTLAAKVCTGPPPVTTPTPATVGLELSVTSKLRAQKFECEKVDVILRLLRGKEVVAEETLAGECSGACTAAARRAGRKTIAEIEARIERGEGDDGELDHNFTECQFSGHRVGRTVRARDRDVALLESISIGAHDVPRTSFQLAFESCGRLFTSSLFGGKYNAGLRVDELQVEPSPDGRQIRVRVDSDDWRGFIYRVELPACPGDPVEKINVHEL